MGYIAAAIFLVVLIIVILQLTDRREKQTTHNSKTQLRTFSDARKVNSITVTVFDEILSLLKSSDINTKGSKPVSLFAAVVAFVDVNLDIKNFADLSDQSFIRLYISPGAPPDAIDTIRKFYWSELLHYGSELLEDDISSGAGLMHFCSAVTKEVLGYPDALFSVEFAHILTLALSKTAEAFPKTED